MNDCQRECSSEGHSLNGCMWLADIKLDWEGSLFALPVPVEAGSRYGVYHCCCNYPTRTKTENEAARNEWRSGMRAFRDAWSKQFGEWPVDKGRAWPCHHIRDLWHGGSPLDKNNLLPAEPSVHDLFNQEYPKCYDGQAPWNSVGPDRPYTDN